MIATPFDPGQELGGLRVLAFVEEGRSMADSFYRSQFLCCGRLVEISHKRISDRVRDDQYRCGECRKAGYQRPEDPLKDGVLIASGPMRGWWPSLS